MKIAFYVNPSNLKSGGIFTYSIGILKLLVKSEEITKIYLIHSGDQKEYFKEYIGGKVEPLIIDRGSRQVSLQYSVSFFLYELYVIYKDYLKNPSRLNPLKKLSLLLNPYLRMLKKLDIDLLHVPVQFSPVYEAPFPVVTTMHDLQEYHYPEFFPAAERLHRAVNSKKALYHSNHIIVSFSHVKKDIQKYFGLSEDMVSVCPPPFAEEWFSKKEPSDPISLKGKYNLPDNFILYPAASWKHKNHIALIETVYRLREKKVDVSLVCTGSQTEHYQVLKTRVEELKLTGSILFLGIISEEDLIGLFKNARAVVIPTLYEAGSGPMYEAMRYGTPVIASNITSLPESMGDNRFIFNPRNAEEMDTLTERILLDEEFRRDNLANSASRIEVFKQYNYAENFLNVFRKVIAQKGGLN